MDDANGTGGRLSRRWFLAGSAAAAVAGGAGVGVGFLQPDSDPVPRTAPRALLDALAAERELLALAAAASRRDPSLRAAAAELTGDHTAHLRALQSAASAYADTVEPPPSTTSALPGVSSGRAQLRAAERAAAATAAARAALLTGPVATLLASISACESTHVELLT